MSIQTLDPPGRSRETVSGKSPLRGAEKDWFLIVNPASGNGKGGRLQTEVQQAMRSAGILAGAAVSDGPGHLSGIAAEALRQGHFRLALLGGDGTANEVINGVFAQDEVASTEVTLGMLSVGTGNDWMRTIGMPRSLQEGIAALARGNTRLHDVGQIWYGEPTQQKLRYFINIAGAGFDGEVTRRVQGWKGWLAGRKITYWLTILRTLFDYRHTQITITVDGVEESMTALTIAAGICRYNGGGMMQLPGAEFDDGLIDVTVIGKMSTAEMVYRLPMVLDGSFIRLPTVKTFRGSEILLSASPPVYLEADGEVLGKSPARITCLPRAIRVIVP